MVGGDREAVRWGGKVVGAGEAPWAEVGWCGGVVEGGNGGVVAVVAEPVGAGEEEVGHEIAVLASKPMERPFGMPFC